MTAVCNLSRYLPNRAWHQKCPAPHQRRNPAPKQSMASLVPRADWSLPPAPSWQLATQEPTSPRGPHARPGARVATRPSHVHKFFRKECGAAPAAASSAIRLLRLAKMLANWHHLGCRESWRRTIVAPLWLPQVAPSGCYGSQKCNRAGATWAAASLGAVRPQHLAPPGCRCHCGASPAAASSAARLLTAAAVCGRCNRNSRMRFRRQRQPASRKRDLMRTPARDKQPRRRPRPIGPSAWWLGASRPLGGPLPVMRARESAKAQHRRGRQ